MCANGSKKAALTLCAVASTWSSCVELPIQRMFLGISAALNLKIFGADAIDAYAHSPAPDTKTYLSVDKAYEEWWNETCSSRSKPPITRKFVIPVQHCLQGHPESGKQWMRFIDNILINEIGFKTTTHDRCIYRKVMADGEPVYCLRQVDDFMLSCNREKTARDIFDTIGRKM